MSILGDKSDTRVSATQWLTDSKTLEKAHLRQNPQHCLENGLNQRPARSSCRNIRGSRAHGQCHWVLEGGIQHSSLWVRFRGSHGLEPKGGRIDGVTADCPGHPSVVWGHRDVAKFWVSSVRLWTEWPAPRSRGRYPHRISAPSASDLTKDIVAM